jgi:hypothetical protein
VTISPFTPPFSTSTTLVAPPRATRDRGNR